MIGLKWIKEIIYHFLMSTLLMSTSGIHGKTVNTTGQILIDTCIATGLRIVNGRIGSDEGIGMNTCRGGSVVL